MLLSAAIIVRDEADHLDACLASLSGLVDEIVVVDTGSSDDSVAVADRHGAI
ncbi:MAG: glycosyltransferase, partial [Solirubrobacteraceae bacterium]